MHTADFYAELDELGDRAVNDDPDALGLAVDLMVPSWTRHSADAAYVESVCPSKVAVLTVSVVKPKMLAVCISLYYSDDNPLSEPDFMPWSATGFKLGRIWRELPLTMNREREKATATLRMIGAES
jgi:hypothetical protein